MMYLSEKLTEISLQLKKFASRFLTESAFSIFITHLGGKIIWHVLHLNQKVVFMRHQKDK